MEWRGSMRITRKYHNTTEGLGYKRLANLSTMYIIAVIRNGSKVTVAFFKQLNL